MSFFLAAILGAVVAFAVCWMGLRATDHRAVFGGLAALGVGGLAAVAQSRLGWRPSFLLVLVELAVLLGVIVGDLKYRVVLNAVTYPAAVGALLVAPLCPGLTWGSAIAGAVVGSLPFLVVALARPVGIGMGDVKLAFAVGAMAGLYPGYRILVVLAAGLGGALLSALALLAMGRATAQTTWPLGATLAAAAMIVLAWLPA